MTNWRIFEATADLKFDILNVVSNNRWGFRDILLARDTVGHEPLDSAKNPL